MRKFTLFLLPLWFLKFESEVVGFYNRQSKKGWHLQKMGIVFSWFTYDPQVQYEHKITDFDTPEFFVCNSKRDTEYLTSFYFKLIFRKKLQQESDLIEVKKEFSVTEYEAETAWLQEQSKKGLLLVKFDTIYYFFKRAPEVQDVEYLVECRHDVDRFDRYITVYRENGWNYLCDGSGNRYYFIKSNDFSEFRDEPSLSGKDFAEVRLHSAKQTAATFGWLGLASLAVCGLSTLVVVHLQLENIEISIVSGFFCVLFFICWIMIVRFIPVMKRKIADGQYDLIATDDGSDEVVFDLSEKARIKQLKKERNYTAGAFGCSAFGVLVFGVGVIPNFLSLIPTAICGYLCYSMLKDWKNISKKLKKLKQKNISENAHETSNEKPIE